MPVKNIPTDNGQGFITKCSDVLSAKEFIEAIRERYTHEESLSKVRYFMTDHSEVQDFKLSTEDIINLTKITNAACKKNPNVYLASVVPSSLGYGLVRMWLSYADDLIWKARLCRNRSDAEQWLREQIATDLTFT